MMTRFLLLAAVALTAVSAQAQKRRIDLQGFRVVRHVRDSASKRRYDQKGIVAADYNLETKQLHVVYKTKKWNEESLHKLATGVGHDTDKFKATDEAVRQHARVLQVPGSRGRALAQDHDHDHDDHR